MGAKMNQQEILRRLEKLYDRSVQGVVNVSPPVDRLAKDYLEKCKDIDPAAKKFIRYQIAKCTLSGFVTGLGGVITMPVAVPINVGSVVYVQMRMIACLARMGGYDIDSDQVRTLIYACLAGIPIEQMLKRAGLQFSAKFTVAVVKKLPESLLTKINQRVGLKFLTKLGTKGAVNIGKAVPLFGGIFTGAIDFIETKVIADRAYKIFIKGDLSGLAGEDEEDPETMDAVEAAEES